MKRLIMIAFWALVGVTSGIGLACWIDNKPIDVVFIFTLWLGYIACLIAHYKEISGE